MGENEQHLITLDDESAALLEQMSRKAGVSLQSLLEQILRWIVDHPEQLKDYLGYNTHKGLPLK